MFNYQSLNFQYFTVKKQVFCTKQAPPESYFVYKWIPQEEKASAK